MSCLFPRSQKVAACLLCMLWVLLCASSICVPKALAEQEGSGCTEVFVVRRGEASADASDYIPHDNITQTVEVEPAGEPSSKSMLPLTGDSVQALACALFTAALSSCGAACAVKVVSKIQAADEGWPFDEASDESAGSDKPFCNT